ncbi:hypothetical protein SI65_00169 [Aspergillus cristatus]|uniref:Uncharacterized protein n=1 Tax=Aspergillus cristatus TaxID=573508 RepID=A0A1E3BNN5_ASPCR|nr:hypothetical protein SI65_00169 [Aspergillus cristatus]
MQSAAFLEKEVSDLQAANEKQKQKRTRSKRQIHSEEGLSVSEASALIAQPEEAIEAPGPPRAKEAFTTFAAAYEGLTEVRSLWKSGT